MPSTRGLSGGDCALAAVAPMPRFGRFTEVIRVPADKGFVGACVKSKQIISVDDAYDDSRFNRSVDEATNFKTRSVMCVPVLSDAGDVVAVVQMINAERGVFDANDEKLGRMLAKHVAIFMAEIE